MSEDESVWSSENETVLKDFDKILDLVRQSSEVYVDREKFLGFELNKAGCNAEQIKVAINTNPAKAGIELAVINPIAEECINYQIKVLTKIFTRHYLLGELQTFVISPKKVPAPFFARIITHIFVIIQKLAYLYGWPEIMQTGTDSEMNEVSKNILLSFLGIMNGDSEAKRIITKASTKISHNIGKSIEQLVLTKTGWYPILVKTATLAIITFTKLVTMINFNSRIIIVGALLSWKFVNIDLKLMINKMCEELKTQPLCNVKNF